MRFIGDLHGDLATYRKLISEVDASVQVGDFGVGFGQAKTAEIVDGVLLDIPGRHRFIRGNHDNPAECTKSLHYIPDGTVEGNTMYVGGALSKDRASRVQGVSWWEDEELSYASLYNMIDEYAKVKPEIMVTHECPEIIANTLCRSYDKAKFLDSSRTRVAFDHMFQIHKPKYWIFGHWHLPLDKNILGTNFICLDINKSVDIEI